MFLLYITYLFIYLFIAWRMTAKHQLCSFYHTLLPVCFGRKEVVGRVRLDSWSLSGLVEGILQTPLAWGHAEVGSCNNWITVLWVECLAVIYTILWSKPVEKGPLGYFKVNKTSANFSVISSFISIGSIGDEFPGKYYSEMLRMNFSAVRIQLFLKLCKDVYVGNFF